MFKTMTSQSPLNVIALDAIGLITDQDYKDILIPAIERVIETNGKARVLIRFGPEFEGYTAHALFDDTVFGLSHARDFERLAVVTDVAWIWHAVALFGPILPCRTRVFPVDRESDAFAWIGASQNE